MHWYGTSINFLWPNEGNFKICIFFNFVFFIPSDYFSVAIMFHGTGQLSRNAGRRLLPCECFSDWKKRFPHSGLSFFLLSEGVWISIARKARPTLFPGSSPIFSQAAKLCTKNGAGFKLFYWSDSYCGFWWCCLIIRFANNLPCYVTILMCKFVILYFTLHPEF